MCCLDPTPALRRLQPRPALIACLAAVSILAGSTVVQAQAGGPAAKAGEHKTVLPTIFSKTKVALKSSDASIAQMLDRLIPSRSSLNYVVEDLPSKTKGSLTFQGSLKDALDRVADLFDYTWRVRKGIFIVFEKRFDDPNEHPQLILPELLTIARGMNAVLTGIPYQSKSFFYSADIRAFYHSLTPEQVSRLERKESLAIGELSDVQSGLMLTALYSSAYHPLIHAWQDLELQLASMPASNLTLKQINGYRVLGYQYPQREYGQIGGVTLRMFQPGDN